MFARPGSSGDRDGNFVCWGLALKKPCNALVAVLGLGIAVGVSEVWNMGENCIRPSVLCA
jgi:hypothetical protein